MIAIILGLIIIGVLAANPGLAVVIFASIAYLIFYALLGAIIIGGLGFLIISLI